MLKTLTLMLTLCVSGGDTSSVYNGKCPYDSVTQCQTEEHGCCKCVNDEEVQCKDWDEDGDGVLHKLPAHKEGPKDWAQTKLSMTADFVTLTSVTGKLPPKMQEFECTCRDLISVNSAFFEGSWDTMQKITIYHSPMKSISDFHALSKLTALESLCMGPPMFDESDTGLTDVSFTSPPFANTLTTLNLGGNLLTSIPDTTMLTKLEKLELDENEISGELSHTFPPSLDVLNLRRNKITTISSLSFPEGKSEEFSHLYLNDNPITAVSLTAFDQIPELFDLDMDGHHLTRLPLALAKLTKLHSLSIKPAVNDEHEPIKDFQCTCEEASLTTWYAAVVEEDREWLGIGVDFSGECKYGSTTISVEHFLKVEAPQCPKNEGGEQDGKEDGHDDGDENEQEDGNVDGKGVGSAGYPIYSSPVLSFFCLVICLLVYVS